MSGKTNQIIVCHLGIMIVLLLFTTRITAQDYAIGHTSQVFIDSSRDNRPVTFEVYFPVNQQGDTIPANDEAFPLIVFAHGYLMEYNYYHLYWDSLVPLGYMMAFLTTEGGIYPSPDDYGLDMAFAMDKLAEENVDELSPFYSSIATKRAFMGHSMGGGASYLAGKITPEITTIVTFAPAETVPSAASAAESVNAPSLIFAGSLDQITPPDEHQQPIYDALPGNCKSMITITGGGHCYFSAYNSYCNLGETQDLDVTREEQQAVTLNFTKLWLSYWLKDNEPAFDQFNNLLDTEPIIVVQNECTLGTAENTSTKQILVYPNPADGHVIIEAKCLTGSPFARVMTITGTTLDETILHDGKNKLNLNFSPQGIYLIRIYQNNETTVHKIIKH